MKFTLRNLGRLQEATIDLGKDLIILAGPNNTSKTYVAHAIYGLCRHLASDALAFVMKNIQEFITEQTETEEGLELDLNKLPSDIFSQWLEKITNRLQGQLADILACERDFVAQTQINLETSKEEAKSRLDALLTTETIAKMRTPLSTILVTKTAGSSILFFRHIPNLPQASSGNPPIESKERIAWAHHAYAYVTQYLSNTFFSQLCIPYILTAERAAIQLFSVELSRGRTILVDELLAIKSNTDQGLDSGKALFDTLGQQARRYPLAIQENLLQANDLAAFRKNISPLSHLADYIDYKLLGGTIVVDQNGELQFQPSAGAPRLGLHLASSSVKSLASLSFYLRHVARPGQFLIIDEPELNLHPDNQRRVARVLARLARSGVKVLMTTHSDYIIREINNLIMLSADKEGTLRERLGYSEEETLSPEQVGAYLFDASRAHPIEVKPTGIEVETIDREINALNSVSQDIYFSLFNKDDA